VNTVIFAFGGVLNDFLPNDMRGKEIRLFSAEHQSIKHLIESLGVPHVEVGTIHADGVPLGMSDRPHDGERIEVQPTAPGCPIEPCFLLDCHLGRLAAYLRMSGFDCLYDKNYYDNEIAAILADDRRILLTRDRRLLMRKVVQYGYCLRSLEPQEQLVEVIHHFKLEDMIVPFRRCLRCNHPLDKIRKEEVLDRLEPLTRLYFEEFHLCPACNQVYWKGSHVTRMQKLIEFAVRSLPESA